MRERFFRIELIGIPTSELAEWLGVSEHNLARWITGCLPSEVADVVEVGLALIEMRFGIDAARKARFEPTVRIAAFAAA